MLLEDNISVVEILKYLPPTLKELTYECGDTTYPGIFARLVTQCAPDMRSYNRIELSRALSALDKCTPRNIILLKLWSFQ